MTKIFDTKFTSILVAAAISLASSSAALAHHSFAMFDNSKEVVLDGVVRTFKWANPHGHIILTIVQRGSSVDYPVELSSLNVMSRQGWNRNSLKPGERVKITVHPLKDGSIGGSFASAVKADGTILRSPAPR
jgi:hypothetical protein